MGRQEVTVEDKQIVGETSTPFEQRIEDFYYVFRSLTDLEHGVFEILGIGGPIAARGVRNALIERTFWAFVNGNSLPLDSPVKPHSLSDNDEKKLRSEEKKLMEKEVIATKITKWKETRLREHGIHIPSYETIVKVLHELVNIGFVTTRPSIDKKISHYYLISPQFFSFKSKVRKYVLAQFKRGDMDYRELDYAVRSFYGLPPTLKTKDGETV